MKKRICFHLSDFCDVHLLTNGLYGNSGLTKVPWANKEWTLWSNRCYLGEPKTKKVLWLANKSCPYPKKRRLFIVWNWARKKTKFIKKWVLVVQIVCKLIFSHFLALKDLAKWSFLYIRKLLLQILHFHFCFSKKSIFLPFPTFQDFLNHIRNNVRIKT